MGVHWKDVIVSALLMAAGLVLMIALIWDEGDGDE